MSSSPWEPWMNGQSSLPWATQPIKQSAQQRRPTLWQMYTFFFSRLNFFPLFCLFWQTLKLCIQIVFFLPHHLSSFVSVSHREDVFLRAAALSVQWLWAMVASLHQDKGTTLTFFQVRGGKKIDYSLFTLNAALLRWYELHYILQIWMQYVVIGLHAFQAWAWLWSWVEWDTSVTRFS